jgi:outer membrane protein
LRAGVLRQALASGALAFTLACALAWALTLPVRADTLEQALAQAYQNNPQLNSQRAVVRATDETVPQALSGYKPTVSVTGTVGQEYTSQLSKSPEGSKKVTVFTSPTFGTASVTVPTAGAVYPRNSFGYSPNSVSATLTQTLYNGFQTANTTRQAEANISAARETLRVTEQTILLNGATAYMDLLRDGALLELQRRNVEVLQEQLRQTRDRFIVGEVTRTDVAQAETRLAQGRAAVLTAESNYARSRATYRQVIGVEAGNLVPAAPVDRLTPRRLVEAIEIGRARHPNVGAAMFGIDAAVLQVKINEGSLYPTARLVGTVNNSWETNLTSTLQQFNAFVQGQVTVPLYQGGTEYSRIRQAKETAGQKRIDLETARDTVQAQIVTAWGQLEAAKAQILATQAQVAASEIALNGVREEARVGQRTTLDVLNAQQDLVTARTALVTAQHDRVVASYSLLSAVGELNLPKLGIMIPLYDPMVHYQQVRDAWIGVRIPDGR